MWTPLHRALGLEHSPLSFELIKTAVEQRVAPAEDLDWKEALPTQDQRARDEFGTDVAALLNTRGGLIVYGVSSDQGTDEAREIKPVATGEHERIRLRSTASSNIHPYPPDLEVVGVDDPNTPGYGVVVLVVPPSPDAPHLVGSEDKFGAPFRDGSSTRWMREPDIERAYRDRFTRQADHESWLASEMADVANRLDLQQSIWLVASARSRSAANPVSGRPSQSDITTTLEQALSTGYRLVPDQGDLRRPQLIKELNRSVQDPEVGLRRWMAYPGSGRDLERLSRDVHVELHHDGSVTLAAAIGSWMQPGHGDADNVPARLIESFAIEFIALIHASASSGLVSRIPYAVRVDFLRQNQAIPIVLIDNVRVAGMTLSTSEIVTGSRQLMTFRPVLLDVLAPDEDAALLASAREIATDILSQFGVSRLVHIPPPASD